MRASETVRRASLLTRATLVLNRSWQPVHVTTVRRALVMVFRDAARIVCPESLMTFDFGGWLQQPVPDASAAIRSPTVAMAAPEVVLLTRYNRVPCHEAPFTRRNLFLRDDYTCQYCGRRCPSDRLSVDHVQPRSRGGGTNWENCVLACVGCNARKADQTPREAGLRLLRPPTRPRWTPYLNVRPNQRMESWTRFSPESRRRRKSGVRNRSRPDPPRPTTAGHTNTMNLKATGLSLLAALLAAAPAEAQSSSQLKRELRKLVNAAKKNPDQLYEAGAWAAAKGLDKDAEKIFKKVLKLDAEHSGANKGLGNKQIDGKWLPGAQADKILAERMAAKYSEQGLKEVDGVWVEADHVADAKAGIFHHDGQLVRRDEKIALLTDKVWHPDTGELIPADKLEKAKEGWFPTANGEWIDRKAADKYHAKSNHPWVVRTNYVTLVSTLDLDKLVEFKAMADQGFERVAPLFGSRRPHPDHRPVIVIAKTLAEYTALGTEYSTGNDAAGVFLTAPDTRYVLPDGREARPAICENHKDWAPYYVRHAAAIGYVNAIATAAGEDLPLWFVHGCGALTSRFQNERDAGWFGKQHLAKGGVGNVKSFFNSFDISSAQEPTKIAFNLYQAGLLLSYAMDGGNRVATDALVAVTDALSGKGKGSAAKAVIALELVLAKCEDGIAEHLKNLIKKSP